MTDDLYERYKATLRAGHVALLRGALLEAAEAYRQAAGIAPSRPLPHTSLGGVYLRLGRLGDALGEYSEAVTRGPNDEGALLGYAEALSMAGQRVDAAQALDRVADVQEASARLPEAADTLRRALEYEDNPDRLQRYRTLLREIRMSAGDQAAEQLLARALRLRDEPGVQKTGLEAVVQALGRAPAAPVDPPHAYETVPQVAAEPARPVAEVAQVPEAELVSVPSSPEGLWATEPVETQISQAPAEPEPTPAQPEPPVIALGAPQVEPEAPVVGVMDGSSEPADGKVEMPALPNADALLVQAEAAEVAGDMERLRTLLLGTARAYAGEGRFEAALDTAHRILQLHPGDIDAHLVLVELYVARDWNAVAIDKLALLERIAQLNNDLATHTRLCEVAARAFPKDPRLSAICS